VLLRAADSFRGSSLISPSTVDTTWYESEWACVETEAISRSSPEEISEMYVIRVNSLFRRQTPLTALFKSTSTGANVRV
jgi:hypothetical protein